MASELLMVDTVKFWKKRLPVISVFYSGFLEKLWDLRRRQGYGKRKR